MHRNDVIDMIFRAYPEAESIKDNYGRTPKELSNDDKHGRGAFTLADDALIIIADEI